MDEGVASPAERPVGTPMIALFGTLGLVGAGVHGVITQAIVQRGANGDPFSVL